MYLACGHAKAPAGPEVVPVTLDAALAACDAIEVARGDGRVRVRSLQEWGAE